MNVRKHIHLLFVFLRFSYSMAICTVLCRLVLTAHSYSPQLKLKWQPRKRSPDRMVRGSAILHHNVIYCASFDSRTVYQYEIDKDEWKEHSQCPHTETGLAIMKDLLTAVGGENRSGDKTNKLVTWRGGRWEEVFPPMNTARCNHAVQTDSSYVIAAGGGGETSVEIFNMSSNSWSTVTSLP